MLDRRCNLHLCVFLVGAMYCLPIRLIAAEKQTVALPQATENALKLSRITAPGGAPFHLRAEVREEGQRNSIYKAEVEEFWVAPDKWRRTVKGRDFSQTLIVNGSSNYEVDEGDYYPYWLRDLVIALVDIVPEDFKPHDVLIEESDEARSSMMRTNMNVGTPIDSISSGVCSRWDEPVGTGEALNSVFTTLCLQDGLFRAVFSPYFHATFSEYRPFKGKMVARVISLTPLEGIHVEAQVTKLENLRHQDESLFAIPDSMVSSRRFASVRLKEGDALARLQNPARISWQPVHDGKSSGNFSLMIYVDDQGNVREMWPLNSDNPLAQKQGMTAVKLWKFKPPQQDGVATQMEALLTFHFDTTLEPGVSVLSDREARKLAISKPEPHFLQTKFPKGTEFTVRIVVDEHGRLADVENFHNIDTGLFVSAEAALRMWLFTPQIVNHKPERFTADITFHVK